MKTLHKHALAWAVAAAMMVDAAALAGTATRPPAKAAATSEAAGTVADLSADVTYLLPGAFKPDMSLDDLRRRFGADNVEIDDLGGAEGETTRGLVLFADDPERRAEIFPRDAATQRGIASIRVNGNNSRWHLDNGLRLGMTLAELVASNGKPLSFSGLGWDYGGNVVDWHAGRYQPRQGDPIHRAVALSFEGDLGDGIPLGEGPYRSDDSQYPRQGKLLFIGELRVSFTQPD